MTEVSCVEIAGIPAGDGVVRLATCRLRVDDARWRYADAHATAIDDHWLSSRAKNPSMFNGTIHLLHAGNVDSAGFSGTLLRTDFKSYLHWREAGFPAAGVRDAFGSALIRSAEGHVVLGRQRAGNVNAGLAYLPGGFIDGRDVRADGTIDIAASIMREVAEETGLSAADVDVRPGFILTRWGALLSFALELVSPLSSEALRDRILDGIADDPEGELVDAVVVRSPADVERIGAHPYARVLLSRLFSDPP